MRSQYRFGVFAATLPLFVAVATSAAHATAVRYSAQTLPPPCSGFILGNAISDDRLVTGQYSCAFAGIDHAYLWADGSATTLPTPAGFDDVVGYDVNVAGQVIGRMEANGVALWAFLYDNGVTFSLGAPPGGDHSAAYGINDLGVVCGDWGGLVAGVSIHAFIWDGQMHDVNLPVGPNHSANDINDAGAICGWMGQIEHNNSTAFIYANGVVIDLGKPAGTLASLANALNDRKDACGSCRRPDDGYFGQNRHALLWTEGRTIELGVLPGFTRSEAADLNDRRVVVGTCWNDPPLSGARAFVWRDGRMRAINDLLMPGTHLDVEEANGINESGQIVGSALDGHGDPVAVLLTPVPSRPGDIDDAWGVGAGDLALLFSNWGPCPRPSHDVESRDRGVNETPCPADIDEDGDVGASDLAILLGNWGT